MSLVSDVHSQANTRQWLDSMVLTPVPESIPLHTALENGLLLRKIANALLGARDSADGSVPRVEFDPVQDLEKRKPAHKVRRRAARFGSAVQQCRCPPWAWVSLPFRWALFSFPLV